MEVVPLPVVEEDWDMQLVQPHPHVAPGVVGTKVLASRMVMVPALPFKRIEHSVACEALRRSIELGAVDRSELHANVEHPIITELGIEVVKLV